MNSTKNYALLLLKLIWQKEENNRKDSLVSLPSLSTTESSVLLILNKNLSKINVSIFLSLLHSLNHFSLVSKENDSSKD